MTAAPTSRCRSCQAPIRWAVTTTGKRMPIDHEPTPDGNVTVHRDEAGQDIATVHAVGAPLEGPRWTSHFATCAQAAQHRRTPPPSGALETAPQQTAPPVVADGLETPALPAERRPDWAGCAGCGHRVLNPRQGEPRCPGCQPQLPAGITRTQGARP